ncbi:MAG: sodium-dependent bicarbonate transport family permease [Bacteroidota bacterium]|jgi:hypothetical protein
MLESILHNFFAPPVPFFFIGLLAIIFHSDLEIPEQISKFISLYLLMAIGFKGGVELHASGISTQVALVLIFAVIMAVAIPMYSFFILKRKLDVPNAAALSAAFGSVSAVTFITANNFFSTSVLKPGGEMVAAMALMESPAIIIGVWLYRKYGQTAADGHHMDFKEIMKEAFLNGSIVVLLGSLIVGLISNEHGHEIMQPFIGSIFKGMLSFFLLDMGVVAGKRIKALKDAGFFVIAFGIVMPLINAGVGFTIAYFCGFSGPNMFIFMVLCASASYIAVPAAMRIAVPEANPGIYVPVALAITFPFNIIAGLPLYYYITQRIHPEILEQSKAAVEAIVGH